MLADTRLMLIFVALFLSVRSYSIIDINIGSELVADRRTIVVIYLYLNTIAKQ